MNVVLSARWLPVVRFLTWLGVAEEVHLKPIIPKPLPPPRPVATQLEPPPPEPNRDRLLLLQRLRATDAVLGLSFGTTCLCGTCEARRGRWRQ